MQQPLVSIIIPAYNREQHISEALESILAQTYTNWEVWAVDDGSTDGTVATLEDWGKKDSRIKYLKRDRLPKGAPTCRNIGLSLAKGQLVIFLDSDDLLAPYCLEQRVKAMDMEPDKDFMVFPMMIFKTKPGDLTLLWSDYKGEDAFAEFIAMRTPWQTTGPIWRRKALEQWGGGWWDETVLTWQDWEFHIRMLLLGLRYKVAEDLPDCFLRRDDRERISAGDMKLERLQAKLDLFEKVLALLNQNKRLTPEAKAAFARLIIQHAERSAILYPKENISFSFMNQLKQWNLLRPNQTGLMKTYIKFLSIAKRSKLPLLTSIGYKLAHKILPKNLLTDKQVSKASVTPDVLNQVNLLLYG